MAVLCRRILILRIQLRCVNFHRSLVSNGATLQERKARADALSILEAAIRAADPRVAVKSAVELRGSKMRICGKEFDLSKFSAIKLLAFGKAAEPMAKALVEMLAGIADIREGLVITNALTHHKFRTPHSQIRGHSAFLAPSDNKFRILRSSHPVPDESSVRAGEEALSLIARCHDNDALFVLISGGGSALLEKPAVPLDDLKAATNILLGAGCGIKEINAIRKHLSEIKGGKLAQAASAKGCAVISLILSDIIGDPSPALAGSASEGVINMIASGPTTPDPTTFADAVKIAKAHRVWGRLPASIRKHLSEGASGRIPETPKPGNPIFADAHNFIIASNRIACEGAAAKAKELGYKSKILTTELSCEARGAGKMLAALAVGAKQGTAIICGGETTVTLRGNGKGGRNQEMVLAAAPKIAGKNIVFASMGTDGIDGPTDAAGAIVDGNTIERAAALGMKPEKFLKENDSYNFFAPLGDLIVTGPTGTNVADIQVILIF